MGQGNLPAVRDRTNETVWHSSRPSQKPNPLLLGRPNPDPYPSTHRFCQVWLDMSVSIPSSGFPMFLFMVAFRYPTANGKILTLVRLCPILMYWPPLYSKTRETRSLPQPENESQQRVNDFWSCILGNLSGNWMHTFINVSYATCISKQESNTLPAPF